MNFNLRIGWWNIRIALWRLALCSLSHKKERVQRYYSSITKEVDQIRNFLLFFCGGGGGVVGGVVWIGQMDLKNQSSCCIQIQ